MSVVIYARLIDSLCCLEKVVHVILIATALNNFGCFFPSLVFNISDLFLILSIDAWVVFLLPQRSNVILPDAEGFSFAIK